MVGVVTPPSSRPVLLAGGARLCCVWDTRDEVFWHWELVEQARQWALDHGGDSDTWRFEVWLLDTPFARVYDFARNSHGLRYEHPLCGRVVSSPARLVMLGELPGERLRWWLYAQGGYPVHVLPDAALEGTADNGACAHDPFHRGLL